MRFKPASFRLNILAPAAILWVLSACSGGGRSPGGTGSPSETFGGGVPYHFELVEGDGQTGTVGGTLAQVILVRALNEDGAPVPGVTVRFTPSSGNVDSATAATDSSGQASVAWTLGTSVGFQTLTVEHDGSPLPGSPSSLSITATATAANAARITYSIQPSSTGTASSNLATAPVARIEDTYGNLVTTASHSVTLGAYSDATCQTPAPGSLSAASNPLAAASGIATFSNVAYSQAGTIYIGASAAGLVAACSNAVALASATGSLAFVTQPSGTATAGSAFGTQPVLELLDSSGIRDTSATDAVTLTPYSDSGCTVAAGASLTVTSNPLAAAAGLASFSGVRYDRAETIHIGASAAGYASACSNAIAVSPGTASALAFSTQPSSTGTAGNNLSVQPIVQVRDAYGNVVTSASHSITLAAYTDASCSVVGSGVFSATSNPLAASSGSAAFSGANYTRAETIRLGASAAGLASACSNAIAISAGPASALAFAVQPTSSVTAGAPFPTAPSVSVHDAYGNPIASANPSITIQAFTDSNCSSDASGTLGASSNPLAASSGVAAFSSVTYDQSGTIYVGASASGLDAACSNAVAVSPAPAASLAFATAPSATATAGSAFVTQPAVEVLDTLGVRATSASNSITLAAYTDSTCSTAASGAFSVTANPLSATSGLSAFSGVRYDKAETLYLGASALGLPSICSSAIVVSPDVATQIVFSTQPSATGSAGSALATQPVAQLRDAYGNVASSATDTVTLAAFTDAACTVAGTGTLSASTNPLAAASGSASFAGVSYTKAETIRLQASAPGLVSVCSNAIAVAPGAANALVFTTQPSSSALRNDPLATQPVVTVVDAYNNTVNSSLSIELAAFSDSGCATPAGGSLSATANPLNAASGIASFAGVEYDTNEVIYLGASASGVSSTCSTAITVSFMGAPARLSFTSQPSATGTAGVAFASQPVVTVQDTAGNTITTATNSITLAAFTDSSCTVAATGTLAAAMNPLAATSGQAAFSGVSYTKAETLYLRASAAGLDSACSSAIAVAPGAASALAFATEPAGPVEQNEVFPTQASVEVRDAYGNVVTGSSAPITLAAFSDSACTAAASGTIHATSNPLSATAGTATFVDASYDHSEAIHVQASSPGLTPLCSTSPLYVGLNLEVPIELLDVGIESNTSATTWARSRTSLDTTAYVGMSSTYRFEAVCENAGSTANISLVNSAGTTVATLSVAGSTSSPTRFETTFTPTPGAENYRIVTPATVLVRDIKCYSARIKVQQVAASATRIYIPLVGHEAGYASNLDGTAGPSVDSTTSNTFAASANPERIHLYRKDTTRFSTLNATDPWTLEVITSSSAGTPRVQLYNRTAASTVGAELNPGSSAIGIYSLSFADNATGFTEGHDFEVRLRRNGGPGGTTAYLYKAGLWVSLVNLSKAASYYRIGRLLSTVGSTTVNEYGRTHLDTTRFSNPSVIHLAMGRQPSSGTSAIEVLSSGTSESGATGTAISGSSIDFASTSMVRMEASGLSIVSGYRFLPRLNVSSGSISGTSFLLIQAQ